MRGVAASALCVLLALGGADCKKSRKSVEETGATASKDAHRLQRALPETLVLAQVLLDLSDPDGALDIAAVRESELARDLGAQLVSSGALVARKEDVDDSHRAREVEALVRIVGKLELPSPPEPGSVAVAVESSLRYLNPGPDDREPRTALIVEQVLRTQDSGDIRSLSDTVLRSALVTTGESLVDRVVLQGAADAELLELLAEPHEDPSLLIWALQLAAQRGLREAVPIAIAALRHADEDVQAAAIAALVELRDPRAVAALSQSVDFKDYEMLRVVMEAISVIGGEEARDFLEFVESGHEDADMRSRARECIEQLARRERSPSSSTVD